MIAAVVAMVVMIVVVDQVFWRPIVVWSERFKMEETAEADKPQSWVLNAAAAFASCIELVRQLQLRRLQSAGARPRRPRVADGETVSSRPRRGRRRRGDPAARAAGGCRRGRCVAARGSELARAGVRRRPAWHGAGGSWSSCSSACPARPRPTPRDWLDVAAGAAGVVRADDRGGAARGGVGAAGRHPDRPVAQVVAAAAADHPGGGQLPRPDAVSAGHHRCCCCLHVPFTVGCVALMLLGAQWYILFNVIAGAMAIPGETEGSRPTSTA